MGQNPGAPVNSQSLLLKRPNLVALGGHGSKDENFQKALRGGMEHVYQEFVEGGSFEYRTDVPSGGGDLN